MNYSGTYIDVNNVVIANIIEIGAEFGITTTSNKDSVSWAYVLQQCATELPKLSVPDALT